MEVLRPDMAIPVPQPATLDWVPPCYGPLLFHARIVGLGVAPWVSRRHDTDTVVGLRPFGCTEPRRGDEAIRGPSSRRRLWAPMDYTRW